MVIFKRSYKVEPKQFVEDLAKKFNFRGLDYDKVKGQVFLCCPFHSGGKERTASANISLVKNSHAEEGDFYCFGCKTKGRVSSFLSKLFGDPKLAQDWVESKYGNMVGQVEEERLEIRKIEIPEERLTDKQRFDLREDAYWAETSYYEKRGIPDELVKKYRLGYIDSEDPEKRKVYLPVFDSEGDVVFFQTRNIHNKSFYLPKGAKKVPWNANTVEGGSVVVCESIFNAVTVEKFGRKAIAIFGTGYEELPEQLLKLPAREFIIALDPDEAGRLGTKELASVLKKAGRLVSTLELDLGKKDLNDLAHLSQEEFDTIWNRCIKRGTIGG